MMLGVLFTADISVQPSGPKQPTSIACHAGASIIHSQRPLVTSQYTSNDDVLYEANITEHDVLEIRSILCCSCTSTWMDISSAGVPNLPAYLVSLQLTKLDCNFKT